MASYSNIHDAFNTLDHEELDRMAREYNNSKKRMPNMEYTNMRKDIESARKFVASNDNIKFNYYDTQGKIETDDNPGIKTKLLSYPKKEPVDHGLVWDDYYYDKRNEEYPKDDCIKYNCDDGNDCVSEDTYDTFMKKLNKMNKSNKKEENMSKIIKLMHEDNMSDSSDDLASMLQHIKSCTRCKKKFKTMFKKESQHVFQEETQIVPKQMSTQIPPQMPTQTIETFETDTKTIILVIIIGIAIIFAMDLINRSGR